jgi:homocysteine S-methyltransferase
VLVRLLDGLGIPAWFSFSAQGLQTRAGQPLADAFALAANAKCVVAVGVNCCSPSDVLPAVELATAVTGRPAVAYPNTGEEWEAGTGGWAGDTSFDAHLAPRWVQAGAGFIGGCCQVGPRDIAALAAEVDRA